MVTRTFIAALCCLGLAPVAGAQAQSTPTTPPDPRMTINQRLENQHDRIQDGTEDKQLTKGERTTLRADDAAIRAQEKVYRQANDGKLTNGERRQLTRELNRTSRQILGARHPFRLA